jgi:hypothetical protein
MKKKDLIYLLLAVGILLGTGYVGYTQLMPKQASSNVVEVETVGAIPDHLDATGLAALSDPNKVQDFNSPVDLTGLGNTAVFGQ